METVFLTIGVFATVMVIMALGVIFSNKPLQGSCGGIGKMFGFDGCMFCEKKRRGECKKDQAA